MKLSDLDARLLALLREDARLSFRDLAERTGVTTPTVSARVKDLEDLGVVQGYSVRLNPALLGGTLHLVTVRARPSALAGVASALRAVSGVEEVLLLAGGALHARVRVRPPATTLAALHEALATLPDVAQYEVTEVLTVAQEAPVPTLAEGTLDVPCNECKGPIHGEPIRGRFGERAHVFCCKRCLADFRARFERLSGGAAAAAGAAGPSHAHAHAHRGPHAH